MRMTSFSVSRRDIIAGIAGVGVAAAMPVDVLAMKDAEPGIPDMVGRLSTGRVT
jgi:hypothetical protein